MNSASPPTTNATPDAPPMTGIAISRPNEIEELKKEIARLKAVPAAPTDLPADAVKAKTKWQERGEKVLVGLSTTAISETSKALWARFGDQLIDGAKAIGEWIASLNLPSRHDDILRPTLSARRGGNLLRDRSRKFRTPADHSGPR